MNVIDLNCDMGESFGRYKLGLDEEVIKYISSANIACGFHAGDPHVMNYTIALAQKYNVEVGAHPGYPDLIGFGRRSMNIESSELKDYIIYQLGAIKSFCSIHKTKLSHVKPHGALYNDAAVDYKIAKTISDAVYEVDKDLILLALAGSIMEQAGREAGLKVACEVFGDRNYNSDGTLVSRKNPEALIHDEQEVTNRVVRMVQEGRVKTIQNTDLNIKVDSICVHGDTRGAVDFVRKIKQTLESNNIKITGLKEVINAK